MCRAIRLLLLPVPFVLALIAPVTPALAQSPCGVSTSGRNAGYRIAQEAVPCITVSDAQVVEDDPSGVLTFTISKDVANETVTIAFEIDDGTAIYGQDYETTGNFVSLNGANLSQTVEVPVIDDTIAEPDETLHFKISVDSGSGTIGDPEGIGTIVDDDRPPPQPPPVPSPSPSPSSSPFPTFSPLPGPSPIPIPGVSPSPSLPAGPVEPGSSPSPSPSPSPAPSPPASGPRVLKVSVVGAGGSRSAPPGGGLHVTASGFSSCPEVQFRLDGSRVGSAVPDAAGRADASALSVPAQVSPGTHDVTARCTTPGFGVASTHVDVTDVPVHRSALVLAVPQPGQVSTDPAAIGLSILAALIAIVLVALPAELFNSTLDENEEEIRSLLKLGPRYQPGPSESNPAASFLLFVLGGGFLYALLSPGFGADASSLALATGMSIALAVTSAGFGLPKSIYMRLRYGEWGRLTVVPSTLVVSAIFVLLSLTVHLNPGLIYGVVAGIVFLRELDGSREGKLTLVSCLFMLLLCIAAWFARSVVSDVAARPGAGFGIITLEAALSGIVLVGLESLTIGLLPLKALTGRSIADWSFPGWLALFTLTAAAFIHILLTPSSGYVSPLQGRSGFIFIILAATLAAGSIAFWAFFEYRKR